MVNRPILILAGTLVLFFAGITLWKVNRRAEPGEDVQTALSEVRKGEVRRFWEVYRRATELRQRGGWTEAVWAYREALEIDPRHEDALYYLGNALFELGRYAEAVRAWQRLTEVNPTSARGYAQLGAVYSCGAPGAPFDLGAAERAFQRALAINPEESGPLLKLGEVALLKGDGPRALAHLTTVSQTNLRSVECHYLIGYLGWRGGDRAGALAALQRAVRFSQGDPPVKGVPGEGDTRRPQPSLSDGAIRKSIFGTFWAALKGWPGEVSGGQMDEEYRRLDAALSRLRLPRR